jgi:hypothetical protein
MVILTTVTDNNVLMVIVVMQRAAALAAGTEAEADSPAMHCTARNNNPPGCKVWQWL